MIGSQSQNTGLPALPSQGPVTIDGSLNDWDLSGRIQSFSDIQIRKEYSVETAAMWDAENLYLALRWRDPSPLHNEIDPKYDPKDGWKSDSVQMRVLTDHPLWITAWHFNKEDTSNILLERWKNPDKVREGMDATQYFGKPGNVELGDGVAMAFRKEEGGYTQEIRLPWKLLYKDKPEMRAGSKIRVGFEFIWGDVTGKGWPISRYADNMQEGITKRLFFWFTKEAWGDIELLAKGNLPLREYRAASVAETGALTTHADIPKEAKKFTLVIEDEKNHRIRNLIADRSPEEFAALEKDGNFHIKAGWDCRDDNGNLVKPGTYRVRGLWHKGLDAIYDTTYYNPGTPPWETYDGSGSWGSNHLEPKHIAAAGDHMIVSWNFSEGGSATIGIGPDGRKIWGELRGADPLAADGDAVYGILNPEMQKETGGVKLFRLSAKDGGYHPFRLDGKERPFPLPLAEAIGTGEENITAMAAGKGELALAFASGEVILLDGESAQTRSRIATGKTISSLAYDANGTLVAIMDGALGLLAKDGAFSPIVTPGMKKPGALAVDADGNALIFDAGEDQQIKAYNRDGRLVYTAGLKGGRPIRGKFLPEALNSVTSIAVDAKGQIWATEHTLYPRRVSVWNRDGQLVRDYIGPTGYNGVGGYFADDPDTAYMGPMEIKLDRKNGGYAVARILWKSDPARADEPPTFDVSPRTNAMPVRFRSAAGGVEREFLFKIPSYSYANPSVLFMEDDGGTWRPVAATGLVGQISGDVGPKGIEVIAAPSGEFAGLSAWDGFFWNDKNEDGRLQRDECEIIPAAPFKGARPITPAIPVGSGWNTAIDPVTLAFYTQGIYRIRPISFTKKGAPVYSSAGIELVTDTSPDLVPMPLSGDKTLIGIKTNGLAKNAGVTFAGINGKTGEIKWSYPNRYPGVHGSHLAPMPEPGLIIGPLKIMGSAKISDEIGTVFAIRGNLGEDYFFTADGLNVGALFRDRRFPTQSLPNTIAKIQGTSVAHLSEGGEPFSGWFGKLKDGSVRMNTSLSHFASLVVKITGLDTIRHFDGTTFTVTEADLAVGKQPDTAPETKPASCHITRSTLLKASPFETKSWSEVPSIPIKKEGFPESAAVRLAYDDENLYVRFEVADTTPMANRGKDPLRLFKTGDAVDLQIGPLGNRKDPNEGDQRLLISFFEGKPVAILMRPFDSGAPADAAKTYSSPVGTRRFARVEPLRTANLNAEKTATGYQVSAVVPWRDLAIQPRSGTRLKGDFGWISSDSSGLANIARTYWSNKQTGLADDEPMEAWLYPLTWGEFILE
ncbi:MAG: sugar-binding protein [Chthoniobacterales bacterium]